MPDSTPSAFFSYTRFDDQHDGGNLSQFRERLAAEVQAQTGRKFDIFQDHVHVKWGQNWRRRITGSLKESRFYIPIITPSFFTSDACREELALFQKREKALGRDDLILPVYYITCDQIDDRSVRDADPLAQVVQAHQHTDWRKLRHLPVTDRRVRVAIEGLARQIREALKPKQAPPVTVAAPPPINRAPRAKPNADANRSASATPAPVLPAPTPPATGRRSTAGRASQTTPKVGAKPKAEGAVSDSGPWLYLSGHFFVTESFDDQDDGSILAQIAPRSAEEEADLRGLEQAASRGSGPLGFAYKNRASLVSLGPVKERSVAGRSVMTLLLKPKEASGSLMYEFDVTENGRTYSADDIAKLKARFLLLNEPMPQSGRGGYSLLSSGGPSSIDINDAILPALWRQKQIDRKLFLPWARLVAVYHLIVSGVCDHVLELRLGPVEKNAVPVTFRGRRHKRYVNQEPTVIAFKGTCPLG